MADSPVELPSRLAILPFRNKVLLPGAIVRIRCTNPSSVKLVEQELWQKEERGLIGVLPVRDSEATAVGSLLSPGVGSDSGEGGSKAGGSAGESSRQDTKNGKEPIHWHSKGVAARALHLSRGVEKPSGRVTYIVVLEGLCRFNVQELSARGPYHVARVSRLDMTKTELEQAEQDPDLIALSRQFKATAMELISVLEQRSRPGATYSLGAKADKKGSPLALTTGHSQVWPPPRQAIRHQPCLPESYQNTMVSILPKSSCP